MKRATNSGRIQTSSYNEKHTKQKTKNVLYSTSVTLSTRERLCLSVLGIIVLGILK